MVLVALLSSAVTLGAYKILGLDKKEVVFNETPSAFNTRLTGGTLPAAAPGEFTYAAEKSLPAVVHIKSTAVRQVRQQQLDMFDLFGFGDEMRRPQKQQASGSGVIISGDGYIVTNNHVVQGADEVDVILNDKREFKAKVIGTDPNTDIAVIQIKAGSNLPFLSFGDSDALKVGEWVLAVGNPFGYLESTVTAGIVSAKGRGIGILENAENPIESFIQTDAAVNPGNSGGPLVNLKGEIIGINTAIAGGQTGTFVGYSFAVPVSIVRKVSADLLKYGTVQRGFLGITKMQEVNNKLAEELDLKVAKGIYVGGYSDNNSAAKSAGVKIGDVITKVDGIEIKTMTSLLEAVGRHKPGDNVVVTVNRDGVTKDLNVALRNREGNMGIVKGDEASVVSLESLGARLSDLSDSDKQKLKVSGGAKVLSVEDGGRLQDLGIGEGFVITKIGESAIRSAKDVENILANKKGRIRLEGTYVDEPGSKFYFEFYK